MSSSRISLRSLPHLSPSHPVTTAFPALAHPRRFHDYIKGPMAKGTYKVPLSSPKVVGAFSSRGHREYQEDASSIQALQLSPQELQSSLSRLKNPGPVDWDPSTAGSPFLAHQVAYFGIFDGHGGKQVSQYLSKRLHALIEQVDSTSIRPVVEWTKEKHEGYFKRWRGGALQRWTQWADGEAAEGEGRQGYLDEHRTFRSMRFNSVRRAFTFTRLSFTTLLGGQEARTYNRSLRGSSHLSPRNITPNPVSKLPASDVWAPAS
ncbi:PP2Cc protein phosphatase [Cryptococcus deuterogattii LA55]|nr:PP2Cc protein phosphatase [Cryptococcus deuterogattii LA55]KIR70452.1 PP2Cc protein phosphatase [Cryptococcus deuterogattii CA1014]KIR90343.1 PP2Cc protein phosphatase [Cryptococcus deuterogattii CBS 10090]